MDVDYNSKRHLSRHAVLKSCHINNKITLHLTLNIWSQMKTGICGTAVGYVEVGEGLQAGDQIPKFVWFAVELVRNLGGSSYKMCVIHCRKTNLSAFYYLLPTFHNTHVYIIFNTNWTYFIVQFILRRYFDIIVCLCEILSGLPK